MTSIAALSSTVYDMIPQICAIRGEVIGLAFIAEVYACRARDNQPSSDTCNYSIKGITIDLSKWTLVVGACRSLQVITFLSSTRLFKSYWIAAPCALAVLVTSLPLISDKTSSSAALQTFLQTLNVASKSLRIVAKIVNSLSVGILVQQLCAPEDPTEYEELNMAKITGFLALFNSLVLSLYLEFEGIQKKPE